AAIDRDRVALTGVEHDVVVDRGLFERERAALVHLAVDEHLVARVEHAQRDAFGRGAVREAALADDRGVLLLVTAQDRTVSMRRYGNCRAGQSAAGEPARSRSSHGRTPTIGRQSIRWRRPPGRGGGALITVING